VAEKVALKIPVRWLHVWTMPSDHKDGASAFSERVRSPRSRLTQLTTPGWRNFYRIQKAFASLLDVVDDQLEELESTC
jgi:hypothetical protein